MLHLSVFFFCSVLHRIAFDMKRKFFGRDDAELERHVKVVLEI